MHQIDQSSHLATRMSVHTRFSSAKLTNARTKSSNELCFWQDCGSTSAVLKSGGSIWCLEGCFDYCLEYIIEWVEVWSRFGRNSVCKMDRWREEKEAVKSKVLETNNSWKSPLVQKLSLKFTSRPKETRETLTREIKLVTKLVWRDTTTHWPYTHIHIISSFITRRHTNRASTVRSPQSKLSHGSQVRAKFGWSLRFLMTVWAR